MRHVKWIFVVLLISTLTSFIAKDKPTRGLNLGDIAPGFKIKSMSNEQPLSLNSFKGKRVLLSFWASYDAQSRLHNTMLSNAIQSLDAQDVIMVSVSFDEYQSVFEETIRKDQIVEPVCFLEAKGEKSNLFKRYNLNQGFSNYLLDENGVILAKNISTTEFFSYIN